MNCKQPIARNQNQIFRAVMTTLLQKKQIWVRSSCMQRVFSSAQTY